MENILELNIFESLDQNEMMEIDGGVFSWAIVTATIVVVAFMNNVGKYAGAALAKVF